MLDEDTKRLVDEVALMAGSVGGGVVMKRPAHEVTILALFDRCRSTFGAVRLLAKVSEPDFGQEAAVLTRSLITESLMLMELAAADGTQRIELVAGWELAGLDDMEGLLREGQARGQDSGAALEATALRKREVETYARERGAGTGRWRVDEKALADKHGREDYLSFRMMHHFVHRSAFALMQRYRRDGDAVAVGGPAADATWGNAVALNAASALVYATRSVCTIFDWDQPAELDDLDQRIEAADRRQPLPSPIPPRPVSDVRPAPARLRSRVQAPAIPAWAPPISVP